MTAKHFPENGTHRRIAEVLEAKNSGGLLPNDFETRVLKRYVFDNTKDPLSKKIEKAFPEISEEISSGSYQG